MYSATERVTVACFLPLGVDRSRQLSIQLKLHSLNSHTSEQDSLFLKVIFFTTFRCEAASLTLRFDTALTAQSMSGFVAACSRLATNY